MKEYSKSKSNRIKRVEIIELAYWKNQNNNSFMKCIIDILLFNSIITYSQTGIVKGKVVDKITKEVLPYVNVVIVFKN